MKSIVQLVLFVAWIAGIIIAKGFWSVFFAIIIPFWSYYLVVEQLMARYW